MAEDLPTDVRDTLGQLLAECATALEEGNLSTASDTIDSARTVATNKLPEGEFRAHFLHGCDRVSSLVDPEDDEEVEADAAGEYVAALQRRLPDPE